MKNWTIRLLLCLLLTLNSQSPADCDPTGMPELMNFLDGWLTTTDLDDFVLISCGWLGDPQPAPTADNLFLPALRYNLTSIQLTGSDFETMKILTLPASGELYDLYGRSHRPLDTNKAGGLGRNWTKITTVPYTVKKYGTAVSYYTETMAADSFTYAACRGTLQSSPATVSLVISDYERNSLHFDRTGAVVIPHNSALDFDEAFTFSFWFRPQGRYGTILQKKAAGGPGVIIRQESKRLVVEVQNTAGESGRAVLEYLDENFVTDIDLNKWYGFLWTVGAGEQSDMLYMHANIYGAISELPPPPYSNTEPVIIGSGFLGQIDKLIWLAPQNFMSGLGLMFADRQEYTYVFYPATEDILAEFRCDEGTGGLITDTVSGTLQGVLTNVGWLPDNRPRQNKYNFN